MKNTKRMSLIKYLLLFFVLIPCFILFSACDFTQITVSKIEKTSSLGLVDTYTITYSDGSTSEFTVTNGKDGIDGQKGQDANDVTIDDIYKSLVAKGYTGSFENFLKEYLSYEQTKTDKTANINKAMLTSVSVYSEHKVVTETPVYSYSPIYGYYQTGVEEVKNTQLGAGSGIIYDLDKEKGDAYLLTNYHVVYNNKATEKIGKISAFLYGSIVEVYYDSEDGENYVYDSNGFPIIYYGADVISCEYVGGSMTYDIAVLKITNSDILKNSNAEKIKIADSYCVGETAIAIGNPEAEGISVTEGIVSVDSEYFSMTGVDNRTKVTFRTIRIDTPINSGNSGGGLFNEKGELIGIVNAKITASSIEHIAYAIPRDIVVNVAENIIYNNISNSKNCVNKITVGLVFTYENSKAVFDNNTQTTKIIEDVIVKEIVENSLESTIGIKVGDKFVSVVVNDQTYKIDRMYKLIDLALNIRAGDTVYYNLIRDGEEITLSFVANNVYFEDVN